MNIIRRLLIALRTARQVATMKICTGCRRPFRGEGVTFKGKPWCSLVCVPAVLRMESDASADLAARARNAGVGA